MRALLLDTNIVIAAVNRTMQALGPRLLTAIDDPETPMFVSVASLWEIAIKYRLGKLDLQVSLEQISQTLADMAVVILPVDIAHALAFPEPVPNTKDPFDRLLLGVCAVEQMKLITTDRQLAAHPLAW